jgi:hypothetical protein
MNKVELEVEVEVRTVSELLAAVEVEAGGAVEARASVQIAIVNDIDRWLY